jgi:hypothetical protein
MSETVHVHPKISIKDLYHIGGRDTVLTATKSRRTLYYIFTTTFNKDWWCYYPTGVICALYPMPGALPLEQPCSVHSRRVLKVRCNMTQPVFVKHKRCVLKIRVFRPRNMSALFYVLKLLFVPKTVSIMHIVFVCMPFSYAVWK